ncbi:MAG: hypothetical protein DRI36_04760 [Caldiserica bacterium]|nr:MAG: hypothetical protein DRI36_04760 [Caldisericota bacterium]
MKKLREIPLKERPQEKLIREGPDRLKDYELLSLIVRSGTKDKDVIAISKEIIRRFGSKIVDANFDELKRFKGVGVAKAVRIVACFELAKRFLKEKKVYPLLSPVDVWKYLIEFAGKKKEYFIVLYLDVRNQEIGREVISVGTLNMNVVHPREVFEVAIRNHSAGIIVAHNHPSGAVNPSKEDIEITKRIKNAGEILGIELLDHIIISKEGYFSFKENSLI